MTGLTALSVLLVTAGLAADDPVVSPARRENSILVHDVESPYQAGVTKIRVLLPNPMVEARKYPVIYVLPVEAGDEARYGNGLVEVERQGLHKKYQAIFVAPTFSQLPWYADHATEPLIRQESYFLRVVMPFIERTYPVLNDRDGRLLLGFSKSGWGAWSLLLRHPEVFGRAAAWDAPLMMDRLGKYGTAPIFGTDENFQGYQVAELLGKRADSLGREKRLILTGYGNFREQHEEFHGLLEQLNIPHDYRDGPERKHDWHSGWVPEAVDLLLKQSGSNGRTRRECPEE
jgi:S-formylglutathione hydrolase FrmB